MSIRVTLAILAGRCVKLAAKILRRGGTAKPGEIALKLCPDLPARLAKDVRLIVVTGTNGKTTTCRIVEQALQDGEGLQMMRTLAKNMAFLMKSIELGKEKYGLPEKEPRVATNFIRQ